MDKQEGGGIPSVVELLAAFEAASFATEAERIVFEGVGQKDVYNITAPFAFEGETLIGGRVESRDTELAESVFFVD